MAKERKVELSETLTSRPKKALKKMRVFITAYYGIRCPTRCHGCKCCQMWALYDAFEVAVE